MTSEYPPFEEMDDERKEAHLLDGHGRVASSTDHRANAAVHNSHHRNAPPYIVLHTHKVKPTPEQIVTDTYHEWMQPMGGNEIPPLGLTICAALREAGYLD
jgi:hypothetical protein